MRCFPFDSVNTGTDAAPVYDREANSSDLADWFGSFFSNGVLPSSSGAPTFRVSVGTGMSVNVSSGAALINGRFCSESVSTPVSLGSTFTQGTRTDLIVLRLSLETEYRRIYITRIAGTVGSGAPYASVQRNASEWDLVLAEVKITGGNPPTIVVTNVHALDSVSYGTNQSLKPCGIVTVPLQKFEIGAYYEKFADDFDEWFTQLKNALNDDENGVAGTLVDIETRLSALDGGEASAVSIADLSDDLDDVQDNIASSFGLTGIWKNETFESEAAWDSASNATEFAAQAIKPSGVDLSQYPAVYVEFRLFGTYFNKSKTRVTHEHRRDRVFLLVWKDKQACAHGHNVTNNNVPFERHVYFTETDGIVFADVLYNKIAAGKTTEPFYGINNKNKAAKVTANVCLIPMAIYGVTGITHYGI